MTKHLFPIVLLLLSSLAGAQDPVTPRAANPLGFLINIFSPKPAALAKLLDEKKLADADAYLATERKYFLVDNKAEQIELLRRASSAFNAMYEPEFERALSDLANVTLAPSDGWRRQKGIIRTAEALISDYNALQISSIPEFRSKRILDFEAAINAKKFSIVLAAATEFSTFDHTKDLDFFAEYPVSLAEDFLTANTTALQSYISSLSTDYVIQLKNKYGGRDQSGIKFNDALLTRFLQLSLPEGPSSSSMVNLVSTIKRARAAGFIVSRLPDSQVAFVEANSKSLLAEGQIEFPTVVAMDLPFESKKIELDSFFDFTADKSAKYIVVLDVAVAKATRKVIAKTDSSSRFISGRHSEPNPQYEDARSRVYQAQNELARMNSQQTAGLAAAILQGIAQGIATNNLNMARQALSNTPMMLQVDDFQSYNYSYSEVRAARYVTANYIVIDKSGNRYFKGTVDVSDNKSFQVAYNIHDKDPEGSSISSRYASEGDIANYEKSPMPLPVSLLIEDYLKHEVESKQLVNMVALREEMLADKNKALAAYKSTQYAATPVNDARFQSVVVVSNPKGAIGAGFFVTPDLVLTNFHVIEGSQFIEMRLFNGLETFGKVVKTDVRLDLALIKVQTRGVPVSFYQGNTLDLGATVEAIGHPKGLTFTITRGIVSAVRRRPSVFGVGGKEVLFVQTDAAINPGNSGGPLFIGEKLIGVNNNKMVAGSEGLGFSIHYSEVSDFLKESN